MHETRSRALTKENIPTLSALWNLTYQHSKCSMVRLSLFQNFSADVNSGHTLQWLFLLSSVLRYLHGSGCAALLVEAFLQ